MKKNTVIAATAIGIAAAASVAYILWRRRKKAKNDQENEDDSHLDIDVTGYARKPLTYKERGLTDAPNYIHS